jgi:hypothetical protein
VSGRQTRKLRFAEIEDLKSAVSADAIGKYANSIVDDATTCWDKISMSKKEKSTNKKKIFLLFVF